jgi:RHS repeat-associated protein
LSTSVIRTINQGHFNNGLLRTRSSLTRQREYTYDDLNRLKSSTEILPGSTPQTTLYDYDPLGNITTRGNTTLTYHDTQPHLLEMAGDNTYGYDANGNVGTRVGPDVPGGGQTFEYTPFDLPRSISTGSGAAARTTQFEYTASQTRAVRRDSDTTRYFVGGGLYQRMVTTGTSDTREERFSLNAAGRQLGEIVRKGGADETLFFHADNQGTVDTITTDSQVTYTQDFDPFGAPIDPPDPAVTRSGFTGHQHDNDLGLIDMRGRMYDTFAARFTSADPVLLARFSSQDFNRYSYVSNDPVNNVDPTGYSGMGIYDSYAGMAGCLRMGYGCGGGSAAAAGGEGLSGGPSNGILGIPGTPLGQGILQAGFNVALDLLVNGPAGAGQAGRTWNEPAPSGAPRATGTGVGGMNAVGQNRGGVGPQSAGGSSSPSGLSGGSPLDQSRDAFRHVAELTGNVGTQMIGKVPVAVFGGTAVERDSAITAAMNVLMLSDTGRKMGAELASRRNWLGFGEVKALEIVLVNSGGSYTYPNSQIIAIDLNDIGRAYNSLRPGGVYSYERVLAHELGHAAFGDRDIGIDRMFNVEWNENWVMNELGDTNDRLTYP